MSDVSYDNWYFLGALVASYPIAFLRNRLAVSADDKHAWDLTSSIFLYLTCVGTSHLFDMLIAPFYTFTLLYHFDLRRKPWWIIGVLYAHLGWAQLRETAPHTAPFMMIIVRLVRYVWHVSDAGHGKQMSITELYGYVWSLAGFFTGPTIEPSEYLRITRRPEHLRQREIPQTQHIRALTHVWMQCLALVPAYLLTTSFSLDKVVTTDDWQQASFMWKLLVLPVCAAHSKFKYYIVWKLAEGVCLSCGWRHEDARNVDILGVESASNFYELVSHWNTSTNKFLRGSFYNRLWRGKNQYRATIFTFLVSGYWHGFHAGYYLSFASAALLTVSARVLRRRLRVRVHNAGSPALMVTYNVLGWVATIYSVSYMMTPFVLLSWSSSIAFYKSTYFVPHLICLGIVSFDYARPKYAIEALDGLKNLAHLAKTHPSSPLTHVVNNEGDVHSVHTSTVVEASCTEEGEIIE